MEVPFFNLLLIDLCELKWRNENEEIYHGAFGHINYVGGL